MSINDVLFPSITLFGAGFFQVSLSYPNLQGQKELHYFPLISFLARYPTPKPSAHFTISPI